ncbi:MAG: nuclear transport factor 2 family protein [Pseudomonadales bacterium]|jgi:ketosteroid isomerase-like protein|nr:nuclear transport factor 2 family protein [Pseudomonadales bacterium]
MNATAEQGLATVARLIEAIERGDTDAVAACYTEDARIWHNFDDADQTREENLAVLAWMCRTFPERRYEVLRREPIDGGVLQQHVLHLATADGERHAVPACLIVGLEGDRIRRIEEYMDPSPFSAP